MKYSVCNEMFEGWEFADVCRAASEAGYTGVEVAPFTLATMAGQVSRDQRCAMRAAAGEAGVEIVGLHWLLAQTEGFHINHPDPAVREATVSYMIDLADLCGDLGGTIMVFGSPKQRSVCEGLAYREAWNYAVDALGKVARALEERGVVLCLEPLAPEETDFLNTAAEAARMVREINSPCLRLLLDVKAMSSESISIPDLIRANASLLTHFHANDANKRGPGFGDTDFGPIGAALREIGYQGWVSVEVFDFSPDPLTIARESIKYLRSVASGHAAEDEQLTQPKGALE